MSALRLHRRAASLLALLAMLGFALVPTLSRALMPAPGPASVAEVCTPHGLQRVPLQAPALPLHGEACALCLVGGADALPTPSAAALRVPGMVAAAIAVPGGLLPAQRRDWRQAPPRAPPAA